MTSPSAEPLRLPDGYGTPEVRLDWERVRSRLEDARHFWLATVRPDGRPHVMPVDGVWLDDACFFGGSEETIKFRNLRAEPRAVLHLEDAASAVVVEGVCERVHPEAERARRLADRSRQKYGYAPDPAVYTEQGVWRLRPSRVLSWQQFPRDATRFAFD